MGGTSGTADAVTHVELHHGAATDVGLVREANEDAFLVAPPVFVVADGMGGHEGGALASGIVVEEFERLGGGSYGPEDGTKAVGETLLACQRRLQKYAAARSRRRRARSPGTTVVVALLVEDGGLPAWLLVNLGDSRIYRVHDGELDQVSTDHSVVQELIDAGEMTVEEAAVHPARHVITRAVGGPELGEPDFFLLPIAESDRVLLCTDGITGLVDDAELADILAGAPDPRDAADRLVAAALDAGGDDNATAVVVDVVGLAPHHDHDSEHQRVSLEEKLGALP